MELVMTNRTLIFLQIGAATWWLKDLCKYFGHVILQSSHEKVMGRLSALVV